jgi:hypothetical protein
MKKANIIKNIKLILVILVILQAIMLFTVSTNVYAATVFDSVTSDIKSFTEMGKTTVNATENTSGVNLNDYWGALNDIANVLILAGFAISVIRFIMLLPKLKGDSPEERAEAKKNLVWFVALVFIIAGATKIWAFILRLLDGFSELV